MERWSDTSHTFEITAMSGYRFRTKFTIFMINLYNELSIPTTYELIKHWDTFPPFLVPRHILVRHWNPSKHGSALQFDQSDHSDQCPSSVQISFVHSNFPFLQTHLLQSFIVDSPVFIRFSCEFSTYEHSHSDFETQTPWELRTRPFRVSKKFDMQT